LAPSVLVLVEVLVLWLVVAWLLLDEVSARFGYKRW
jgi:hypothetical protein